LREIAPVTAVRGNNDRGAWAQALPEWEVVDFGTVSIYVRHDRAELDIDPAAAGFHVVVCGHSHKPAVETREGKLMLTRRNDFIMVGGKFPRLTKKEPRARLNEMKRLIQALR